MCVSRNQIPEGFTPIDISSEIFRQYVYPDGATFEIDNPTLLFVMPNGSHRVVDGNGTVHRPTPGYVGICWDVKEGMPYFVA